MEKNLTKRSLSLLLALVLMVGLLAGCGGTKAEEPSRPRPKAPRLRRSPSRTP